MYNTEKNKKRVNFISEKLKEKGFSDNYIAWELLSLMKNNLKATGDVSDVTAEIVTSKEYLSI